MNKRKIGDYEIDDINLYLIITGVFSLISFGYLLYLIVENDYDIISFLTFPLIFGVVIENRRLSTDWKMLCLKIMLSFIVSSVVFAFVFIDFNKVDERAHTFPFVLLFFFALFSAVYHEKNVINRVTEGTTVLQSVSIIYFFIVNEYLMFSNPFESSLLIIGILFSLFSSFNALTYYKLNRRIRLFLSLWSSVVMMIFSIAYIYQVYYFNYFTGNFVVDYFVKSIQYFLLGVASIYIIQNIRMLYVYIPTKNSFFDKEHLKRISRMNELHIWRYSDKQVNAIDSIVILSITISLFTINYIADFIPSLTLIWLIFWLSPIIIILKNRCTKIKTPPRLNSNKS